MRQLLRNNSIFIALSLLFIIMLGAALICIPKGELHLLLCDRHSSFGDIFYRYYTHVAEWLPYALCVLILLVCRAGDAVFAASCQALSALTTQIIKHIVVAPRPLTWFETNWPDIQLPLVEGVEMNRWFSFPSGHTTSFFAIFFALSVILTGYLTKQTPAQKNNILWGGVQILCFAAAAFGGYSRIYLSQHFALDVFGGTCVGVIITFVCYAIFSHYEDKKWYNYRVLAKK